MKLKNVYLTFATMIIIAYLCGCIELCILCGMLAGVFYSACIGAVALFVLLIAIENNK